MSLGKRIQWARDWLQGNTPTAKAASEPDITDYQIVDHEEALSDDGVRSLSGSYASTGLSWKPLVCGKGCKDARCLFNTALTGADPVALYDVSTTISREDIIDLEQAGRHSDQHTFGDLRSGSRVRIRGRKQSQKYYGYRYVKRGDLATNSAKANAWQAKTALLEHPLSNALPMVPSNKKEMYELAQQYPRPPKYHRRKLNKEYSPWSQRYCDRVGARKHAPRVMGEEVEEAELLASDLEHYATCDVCAWLVASARDLPSHVPDEFDEVPDKERQDFTLGQLLEQGNRE